MDSLELEVIDLPQKLSRLTIAFSDSISIDKILSFYELKRLEMLVRDAVKILE